MTDRFHNCTGCKFLDRDETGADCGNGMHWQGHIPPAPFCFVSHAPMPVKFGQFLAGLDAVQGTAVHMDDVKSIEDARDEVRALLEFAASADAMALTGIVQGLADCLLELAGRDDLLEGTQR